ncbi:hypothetical protein AAC387_Pa01g0471 [Persea americana]
MTEVDVVDGKTGKGVKRDGSTLGEIVVRGRGVLLGYLKDPEGTANSLKSGCFYTGDVGVMHPDGYLEIRDRSKDVIISEGENLGSVEVESVLYSQLAINEGAVVARPDEFWGETPFAFVSLKEEYKEKKPSEKEIIAFCRERSLRLSLLLQNCPRLRPVRFRSLWSETRPRGWGLSLRLVGCRLATHLVYFDSIALSIMGGMFERSTRVSENILKFTGDISTHGVQIYF